MKYQVLFSLKNNYKYSRLSSGAVVIGALRVKMTFFSARHLSQTCFKDLNIIFQGSNFS